MLENYVRAKISSIVVEDSFGRLIYVYKTLEEYNHAYKEHFDDLYTYVITDNGVYLTPNQLSGNEYIDTKYIN